MVQVIAPTHQVTYDGANLNVYHANKGQGLARHEHAYAHLKEGIEKIVDKNTQPINLKAAEWHEIEALEDGTVFVNVFAEGKY